MKVRYLPNNEAYCRLTTEELRKSFVVEDLFVPDTVTMIYCDADRALIGGITPTMNRLKLLATKKELAAEYFTERREVGIVNVGGEGSITADGKAFTLAKKDMLYIGKGVKDIECASFSAEQPARFFFISFPAHTSHPTTPMRHAEADRTPLGTMEGANKRTIYKYIHGGGIKSCQLVMGLTELETGSIWNTMPAHTHMRRMEVYCYFDMDADSIVVHLMGTPTETRSLIMRNHQAVISPSWSVHCGAGTKKYSFIWAMGGENQEFSDMDGVAMKDLL